MIPKTKYEIKKELFEKQNGKCHYCGRQCRLDRNRRHQKNTRDFATTDHMTPFARGGLNIPENKVMACHQCNNEKGDMNEKEFKDKLKIEQK